MSEGPRVIHVRPNGDLIAHESDESCACGPTPKFVEGGIIMLHHSLDRREERENPL